MTFGLEQLAIISGTFLTAWILNNVKLKEGLTEWFIDKVGSGKFDADDHTVLETIKGLLFECQIQEFDNKLKEELYKYYITTCLSQFLMLSEKYVELSKKHKLQDLKKETKLLLYRILNDQKNTIDTNVKMPDILQDRFNTFRNYLDKQHIYVLEKALSAQSKTLLNIQLLDALETNIRWMFFYTTDMFEGFNGQFDKLSKCDVFIKYEK
jgi:uncharacterized protein (DUF2267 family)